MLPSSTWLGSQTFNLKKQGSIPAGSTKKLNMTIELTKEMAIHLIRGSQPSYEVLSIISSICDYSDQYGRYSWDTSKLEAMSVEQLYSLYELVK